VTKRNFFARILVASAALTILLLASDARAASINLVGINGSGASATVSNYTLVGNIFSFDLTNTAAVGFITNVGMFLDDLVDATGFTTTAPFIYTIIHDGPPAPDAGSLPANDFFITPPNQTAGINPGQTFHYSFTLTMDDGLALSGITADQLAGGTAARVRGLPTPASGADLLAAVPEPSSLTLLAGGLAVAITRRLTKRR
jgi:hypothetical protein